MTKTQNTVSTTGDNLQEEKKVARRGRPKKSEQNIETVAVPVAEQAPVVKTRKPRTSTTINNEIKPLDTPKSKRKTPEKAIHNEEEAQVQSLEKKQNLVTEEKAITKNAISKKTTTQANSKINAQENEVLVPKKRGRKPKEIINLAQDLELPQEVRELENSLAAPKTKKPVKTKTREETFTETFAPNDAIQNYNAQFIAAEESLYTKSKNFGLPSDKHESIQLLPTQMDENAKINKLKRRNTLAKEQNNLEHVGQEEQNYRDNKQNRGLSKNFFKRVPLDDNAIHQRESMHNPMLYPAPKQLQGKVQQKKQNINPQTFTHEQEPFYPHSMPQYNVQEASPETQYVNWQNNRQKTQNKNFPYPKNNQNNQQNQKRQNQRQHTVKNMPQPAFDNSSIIAAISGKSFEDDMYPPMQNLSFAQTNFQPQLQPTPPLANNAFSKKARPQRNQKKNGQVHNSFKMNEQAIPSDESSLLHQNMMYQRSQASVQQNEAPRKNNKNLHNVDPANLTKLPFFAQTALEHKDELNILPTDNNENPYYTIEQAPVIQEEIVEKKTRGRKKKVETIVEEEVSNDLKMFVSVQSEEQVEVALVKDETVVEYFVEMSHQAKIRGNIYKATIHNVDPNLQAAFINFGSVKNGFLQIDEVHPDYYLSPHAPSKNHKFPLISKVLRPGQELFVQIVKEPTLTKGAFLTTWISLAGRYLVLTPGQEQLGVSRKVSDPDERARLRAMLDGINPDKGMGIIIRTAAAHASQEELQADLDYLQKLWLDILEKSNEKSAPALVHQEVELTQRVVRDYLNENVGEIWTNDKEMAHSITKMAELLYPQKANIVRHFNNQRASLWDRFNLQKQIDEISHREVALPSGGRVVFDQTEALMAIDINSGKTQNKSNFHDMVLQTNIEAAQAIARHLRLRDIGGQIVIDFIEVHDKNAVKEIEKAFKNAMRHDRARYEIGHISPFGLLEVIRQRIGSSAISISTEPCPHCNGTGTRRNMEWQAQDALKEIAKKARQEKTIKYVYTTNTELALYLLNMKRDRISELEERFNVRIEIQAG